MKVLLHAVVLVVSLSFFVVGTANALTMAGGDWQGRDLIVRNGDYFSGIFTNIGEFIVPSGVSIFAGSENVEFSAHTITINAGLINAGLVDPTVAGSSLSISGSPIVFNKDVRIPDLSIFELTRGATLLPDKGGITIMPIPEPVTMILVGIGLAGLAGASIRRKGINSSGQDGRNKNRQA